MMFSEGKWGLLRLPLELHLPAQEEQTQNNLAASHSHSRTHPRCPTGIPETLEVFQGPGEMCWHWGKPRAAVG